MSDGRPLFLVSQDQKPQSDPREDQTGAAEGVSPFGGAVREPLPPPPKHYDP